MGIARPVGNARPGSEGIHKLEPEASVTFRKMSANFSFWVLTT